VATGSKDNRDYDDGQAIPPSRPLFRRPGLWVVITTFSAFWAAYLHLRGLDLSALALAVTGLTVGSLAALTWTLGASGNADPVSALLRRAVDAAGDGVLITDQAGDFVYANPAFHRLFDKAASLDAIEKALEGDGQDAGKAEFKRLRANAENGLAGHTELALVTASGALEWRRLNVSPTTGARGQGGALWRAEDITAGREVDAARRQQESNLADFLDLLPVGFFSADGDGQILYANQTLADWLGVTPQEMTSRPLEDYLSGGTKGEVTVPAAEGSAELHFRRPDGGAFKAQVVQTLCISDDGDEDGAPAYSRSVVIPDMKWLNSPGGEDAPGSPEIRLHWLFDEAPVGIVLLDLDGNVAECNSAFLGLIGLNPEDLIGRPFADRVAQEDRGDIATALSKVVMGTARATHIETRMPGAGERQLVTSLYASRLENALGEISGLALHFIDTTEQKNLEVQFAQSQKMEAIGQLAGGIAHDFNNLLTAMIGFSDLLLTRHGPDDPSFADIQQIKQNANRATNLVRQLLAFSRKQTLAPVRIDVTEQLNELTSLLGRLIGAKIELSMDHGHDLPPIQADRGQFDQIIVNLAVNARDAMPGGGQMTIRTQALDIKEPVQRGPDLMPKGKYIQIEVIDTGTGIRKEDMERIFEPFFSTKEVGAGTGLGLSTVYGIIHQSGGYVFVDSAPGDGTTFSIYLPEYTDAVVADAAAVEAALDAAQAQDQAQDKAPAKTPSSKAGDADLTGAGTVLLVEDEDAVRMFGARALRNKGYHVLEADNGEGALDIISATDQPIDLIISDVVMPGMDGHTLVRLVRVELPDVKIILMSGYAEDVYRDEIGRDPTIHFLAKPFSLKGLASMVKDVMAG